MVGFQILLFQQQVKPWTAEMLGSRSFCMIHHISSSIECILGIMALRHYCKICFANQGAHTLLPRWLAASRSLPCKFHKDASGGGRIYGWSNQCVSSLNGLWQHCTKASQPAATLVTNRTQCDTVMQWEDSRTENKILKILSFWRRRPCFVVWALFFLFTVLGIFAICLYHFPQSDMVTKDVETIPVVKRQGKSVRHWKTTTTCLIAAVWSHNLFTFTSLSNHFSGSASPKCHGQGSQSRKASSSQNRNIEHAMLLAEGTPSKDASMWKFSPPKNKKYIKSNLCESHISSYITLRKANLTSET